MPDADRSMAGRMCMVTGATAGIGYVTARELARRGAEVVVVGRSQERCAGAADRIRRETGNDRVQYVRADLSSQAEVGRLADEFRVRHPRLHVLVNNAGALYATRRESADGIEMTLALNHLGYFLLTSLLLGTIKVSSPARIINVSSHAHELARAFDFEDPQAQERRPAYGVSERASLMYSILLPRSHPAFRQYAQTKLANLLFTYELARRLEGTGVTVNALHPGFVASSFTSGNGAYGWLMRRWAGLLAISEEEGANTTVYLATSPEVEGVTGKYFVKGRPAESSRASRDQQAARRLWELSEELTGLRARG